MNKDFPRTRMTEDEISRLVQLINGIPTNIGWSMSHMMEQPHSAKIFNSYHALVVLPAFMPYEFDQQKKGHGEGLGNTAYEALLRAMQDAHVKAGGCIGGWLESFLTKKESLDG